MYVPYCAHEARSHRSLSAAAHNRLITTAVYCVTGIVPVGEITDLQAKNRFFSWFVSSCYILCGLPLALGSLTIQSFELRPGLDVISPILGSLAFLRELFGPSVFAKFWLCVGWIFTLRKDDRKEFGRAVRRKGLLQQFLFGSCLTPVVVMFTLLMRRVEDVSPTDNLILFLIFFVSGGFFGLLLGVFRGLPTAPDAYFTSWPRNCYAVTYYDKVRCPCIFSWNYCGEIHSRQMRLIISLDDMHEFRKSLMGNLSNKIESWTSPLIEWIWMTLLWRSDVIVYYTSVYTSKASLGSSPVRSWQNCIHRHVKGAKITTQVGPSSYF